MDASNTHECIMNTSVHCNLPNAFNTLAKKLFQTFADNMTTTIKQEIRAITFIISYPRQDLIKINTTMTVSQ